MHSLKTKLLIQDGVGTLALIGSIDEHASYESTGLEACQKLILNLEGINLINSTGIQKWVDFISLFKGAVCVDRCSVRIINQLNMFPGFFGKRRISVLSFYVPYFCEGCDESRKVLIYCQSEAVTALKEGKSPLAPPCSVCKGPLEFDGIEKKYFAFVKYDNVEFTG